MSVIFHCYSGILLAAEIVNSRVQPLLNLILHLYFVFH
jgi:hypothetical protein